MSDSPPVVVTAAEPALLEAAREQARMLGLDVVDEAPEGVLALVLGPDGWSLLDTAPGAPGPRSALAAANESR